MRIIAGSLGGRQFNAPKGHKTHPMSEKARGGLFSVLGDISGLTVLDAFSGSGALAIEAVSRGAHHVTAIDLDINATKTIQRNIKNLNIGDKVKAIRANSSGWSDNNPIVKFDLVFVCPPYDELQRGLVDKLTKHVSRNGVYVLDWPKGVNLPKFADLELQKSKNYGDAQLVFYRKIS